MSLKGNIADTQTLNGNAMMSDGFSPIVEVEKTEAGHKVTITDKYDKKEFIVLNGKDGKDGEKGDTGEFPLDQVKRDFSPSIINSASGETVVTTDSASTTPTGMKLFGKSEQATYQGNQLVDYQDAFERFIKQSDGTYLVQKTSEGYMVGERYSISDVLEAGATYTVSCGGIKDAQVIVTTQENGVDKYLCVYKYGTDNPKTFTPTAEQIENAKFYMQLPDTVPLGTYNVWYMFNKGTTALPFEPYVGGEASPSLSYKQDVVPHGASGSIEQKILNSNIYDTSLFVTASSNGITRELVNGRMHFYGTATTSGNFRLINPNTIRYGKNGKVTLSIQNISGTFYRVGVNSHNNNNWVNIGSLEKNNGYTSVFELGDYDIIPFVMYEQGVTYDTYFDFVINYGEQSFPYEPYSEQVLTHQTPNGLYGQGDVADVVDYGQGKRITRFIKIPFLPTYDWRKYDTNFAVYNLNLNVNVDGATQMCNACHNFKKSGWKADVPQFAVADNYIRFVPNGFTDMTLEDFKARLEESEVYAICEMAEPIVTDLTEEELAQYNAIHMNYPNTTIVNSDSAYTEVEYVADTKCYIDNKFKELEANVTSAIAQLL